MITINHFISEFSSHFQQQETQPWEITNNLSCTILKMILSCSENYTISKNIAIHSSAIVEQGAVIKAPAIIGKECFIAAHAYLRGGVYIAPHVKIGTGCEIKSSIICSNSNVAHFNFVGDSIIGSYVNIEAGAITANHYNERKDKNIWVMDNGNLIDTGVEKFGALIGDYSKIGANAVLSPGTILSGNSIVKRLELIDQVTNFYSK